jgi:hypothetical protein
MECSYTPDTEYSGAPIHFCLWWSWGQTRPLCHHHLQLPRCQDLPVTGTKCNDRPTSSAYMVHQTNTTELQATSYLHIQVHLHMCICNYGLKTFSKWPPPEEGQIECYPCGIPSRQPPIYAATPDQIAAVPVFGPTSAVDHHATKKLTYRNKPAAVANWTREIGRQVRVCAVRSPKSIFVDPPEPLLLSPKNVGRGGRGRPRALPPKLPTRPLGRQTGPGQTSPGTNPCWWLGHPKSHLSVMGYHSFFCGPSCLVQ